MSWGRALYALEALALVVAGSAAVVAYGAISLTLWLILGGVVLVLLVVYIQIRHQKGRDVKQNALGSAIPEEVDIADLVRAEAHISKHYPVSAIDRFVRLLTDISSYLARVDEKMELDGREGKITTNLILRRVSTETSPQLAARFVGQEEAETFGSSSFEPIQLIPLVTVRKGLLVNGFAAYDQSGRRLPTLAQWEIRGLLVACLRALFCRALSTKSNSKITELVEPRDRHVLLQVAAASICATAGKDRTGARERIEAALQMVEDLDPDRFDAAWKARIRSFCSSLARDYVIVVETQAIEQSNFSLRYEHVITAAAVNKGFERERRAKHGLSPVVVDAPMTWALLPDSYHFELTAPPGQYIYDHHLERLESAHVLRQKPDFVINDVQQYVRVSHEQGSTTAHLYIRRKRYRKPSIDQPSNGPYVQPQIDPKEPITDFKSVIRFEEVPPGALGSAVTVALFTAISLTYFAFVRESGLVSASPSSSQSFPALLLGFPAFLAAALGRGITSDSIRSTSLVTFYGLWTAVGTSALAVFLYLFDVARIASTNVQVSIFGEGRQVNLVWAGMALFSIIVYLFLRKEKSDQRRYYLNILKQAALADRTKVN